VTHYVLVCGGREEPEVLARQALWDIMSFQRAFYGDELRVIHGDARGADRLAGRYADQLEIPCRAYPADWDGLGKRAGVVRNERMASLLAAWRALGHTCEAVALPGGNGTQHMIDTARGHEIHVTQVSAAGTTVDA